MLDSLALYSIAVLAAVWLVYPLVVGALARLRRRVPTGLDDEPRVTVVIATREPAEAVARRIANALHTSYAADRLDVVIAVDCAAVDCAKDAYEALAGSRVKVVTADEPGGKAAALNAGVRAATGEVLVFADTYQLYDPQTIPALVASLRDPAVGAATGVLRLPASRAALARAYWGYERRLRSAEGRLHSSVGATGAVYAMRADLWSPLPAGLLLDDVYAPMRVVLGGRRVVVAEGAYALETRASTPSQEFGRKIRTLTGVIQLCAWLPAVVTPWRNPIWVQFVFHKLLRLLTPYLVAVIGIRLAVLAAAPLQGWLPAVLAVVGVVAIWLWRARAGLGLRLRDIVVEAVLLQIAVVLAGVNGLRGRWEVWNG